MPIIKGDGQKIYLNCEDCGQSRQTWISQLVRYHIKGGVYFCRKCWNHRRSVAMSGVGLCRPADIAPNELQCEACSKTKCMRTYNRLKRIDGLYYCPSCRDTIDKMVASCELWMSKKVNDPLVKIRPPSKSTRLIILCPMCMRSKVEKSPKRVGTGSRLRLCLRCSRMGSRSGAWAGGKVVWACSICGKEKRISKSVYAQKKKARLHGACSECYRKNHPFGENSPTWKGGLRFEPYPTQWTNKLKQSIRCRDGFKCRMCGLPERDGGRKLSVHHIDYNKNNVNPVNLISLCVTCHTKTNYNRSSWKPFFESIIRRSIPTWSHDHG